VVAVTDTPAPEPTTCSACGAPIIKVQGASGKRNPLNADPREDGNIWIDNGIARYRSKASPIPAGVERYTSHFADCPDAKQFRR